MIHIHSVVFRIAATFVASGLSVIGVGSVVGVPVWQSAYIAGGIAVARVLESLSRSYLRDGKLTSKEVDKAFADSQGLASDSPVQDSPASASANRCPECGAVL